MHPQFESLRDRLLRAGIAPRHVRRYLDELRDHYEDALRAALEAGASRDDAEASALARLGSEEVLARSMLAQPQLRSLAARFPRFMLGVAPALAWLAAFVATVLGMQSLASVLGVSSQNAPRWAAASAYVLCCAYVRVVPVLLGALAILVALRQRMRLRWAVIGAAVVSLLAGCATVTFFQAGSAAGVPGDQLGISSVLLPFLVPSTELLGRGDLLALTRGLMRAVVMLALSMAPFAMRASARLA